MATKTPSSESSEEKLNRIEQEKHCLERERQLLEEGHDNLVVGGRRLEDQMRIRELELQTNFQIKTLTESMNLLKTDFHSWRDSLNERLANVNKEVDGLKSRLTLVIALLIVQMAGAPQIITKLLVGM